MKAQTIHPASGCARIASGGLLLVAVLVSSLPDAHGAQANPLMAKRVQMNAILRNQKLAGADKDAFTQYFMQFFRQFAPLATSSPGPDDFGGLRKDLMVFRMQGKSGDAYDQLIAWTVKYMKHIAGEARYHLAARVNAILVLGELNESEGVPNPKPLPAAFPLLLAVSQSDRFPDAMKVAAMVGLERWAKAGAVPPDKRTMLEGVMLDLLKQEVPPQGRTAEGHNWMRRSAGQILAALGSPGPDNGVVAAYQTIVADSGARTTLRCEMAECLGQLKFPQGAKIDYQSLANSVGYETVEICQRELDAARSASRPPSRRLLVYALYSALRGLEGSNSRSGLLAASAGTDGQKFIDALRGKVKAAYQTAEDDELSDSDLASKVGDSITEIQAVLGPKPVLKPAAVAAEDKAPPAAAPAAQPDAARAAATRRTAGGN